LANRSRERTVSVAAEPVGGEVTGVAAAASSSSGAVGVAAGTVAAGTVAAGTIAAGTIAAGTIAAGTVATGRAAAMGEPDCSATDCAVLDAGAEGAVGGAVATGATVIGVPASLADDGMAGARRSGTFAGAAAGAEVTRGLVPAVIAARCEASLAASEAFVASRSASGAGTGEGGVAAVPVGGTPEPVGGEAAPTEVVTVPGDDAIGVSPALRPATGIGGAMATDNSPTASGATVVGTSVGVFSPRSAPRRAVASREPSTGGPTSPSDTAASAADPDATVDDETGAVDDAEVAGVLAAVRSWDANALSPDEVVDARGPGATDVSARRGVAVMGLTAGSLP
jgi:hypothetical protein